MIDLRAETEKLRSENTHLEQRLDTLKDKVKTIEICQTLYSDEINNHERFLRKNNIHIVDMRFSPNENYIFKAAEYLGNLLQRDIMVERAHKDSRIEKIAIF